MCEIEHKFADFLPEDWAVCSLGPRLCFRNTDWNLDYSDTGEFKWVLTLFAGVDVYLTNGDTAAESAEKMIVKLKSIRKNLDYVTHNVMKDKIVLEDRLTDVQKRGSELIVDNHYGIIFKKNDLVVIYPCDETSSVKGVGKTLSAAAVDLLNQSTQYLHNLNMFINARPQLKEALEKENEK